MIRALVIAAALLAAPAAAQEVIDVPTAAMIDARIRAAMQSTPAPVKGDKGDTGSPGTAGADGRSAYQIAVDGGYAGTQAQWLASLKGAAGSSGVAGTNGTNGVTPAISIASVTTGAPGSLASVVLGGTVAAPTLSFTIPSGLPGSIGATGAAGSSGATFLPDVVFGQSAVVAISAGYRVVTVPLVGCQANERVLLTPTNLQVGYSVADAFCSTAGQLTVNVYAPALAIGATYSITAKVTAFR